MARPTIIPLRSRTTVTGSQRTPYSRATAIFGSKSVRILWPCFSRYGLTSFSPRPSIATKYTTRSLGNFACRFSKLLSSLVQEEHQVAPKLSTATFPASDLESTFLPERSGSENSICYRKAALGAIQSGALSSRSISSREQLTPQNRHRLTRQSDAFAVQPNLQDPAALGELMRDEAVFPEAFAPEVRQGAVC